MPPPPPPALVPGRPAAATLPSAPLPDAPDDALSTLLGRLLAWLRSALLVVMPAAALPLPASPATRCSAGSRGCLPVLELDGVEKPAAAGGACAPAVRPLQACSRSRALSWAASLPGSLMPVASWGTQGACQSGRLTRICVAGRLAGS